MARTHAVHVLVTFCCLPSALDQGDTWSWRSRKNGFGRSSRVCSRRTITKSSLCDSAARWKDARIQAHVGCSPRGWPESVSRAIAQAGGQLVKEVLESCLRASTTPAAVRWRRRCYTITPGVAYTSGRREALPRARSSGRDRRDGRGRAPPFEGGPPAANCRCRRGGRRRRDDGMRRRVPHLSRRAVPRLGARGSCGEVRRRGPTQSRRDRRESAPSSRSSCQPPSNAPHRGSGFIVTRGSGRKPIR